MRLAGNEASEALVYMVERLGFSLEAFGARDGLIRVVNNEAVSDGSLAGRLTY